MYPKVEKYLSNGQLQKLLTTRNTPLPVMFGALAVCSMRYGVLDTSHLKAFKIPQLDVHVMYCRLDKMLLILQVIEIVDSGKRLPPPPGCSRVIYELMIKCWLVKFLEI